MVDSDRLKSLQPFSWFTDEQLEWALPTVQHRMYAARTFVLRPGSPAEGIYILLSGSVHVVYETSTGRRFIAASIRAHDFFGETDLFDARQEPSSVISAEPCEMLYIPRTVALECLKDNARASMCMLRTVAVRARLCQRALAQFALSDVYARVAAVLLNHVQEADGTSHVNVGSEHIAALVGSSREMVSRVLKEMIRQGLVRRSGRTLHVIDPGALQLKSATALLDFGQRGRRLATTAVE